VPTATKIAEISYDEMLEMASSGSKVMQSRSVEFAKKFGVVFEVRSSFQQQPRNHRKGRDHEHGKRRRARHQRRKESGQGHHPPGARSAGSPRKSSARWLARMS
jgi:hypothetical protein